MSTALPPITDSPPPGDLLPRILVGGALIVLAVGDLWIGGWWFVALAAVAVLLLFAEWAVMHRIPRGWRALGLLGVGLACVATHFNQPVEASVGLTALALAMGLLWKAGGVKGARWMMTGLLYAGLPGIALIWLRDTYGFEFVIWLMALVWATDIFAYFFGRGIGGPKIAPAISPKKTWAGLGGGMLGAAAVSAALAPTPAPLAYYAALGAGLAVVAQVGDFFESWLKRRVGVKDSGTLLPGHGGVMDRLDGLVPVAVLVGAYLVVRDVL
jgi:phosphatidate cytidylyltransferase